jgi:hypothetical protein
MGDPKHPGIQLKLKATEANLDAYGKAATIKGNRDNSVAMLLSTVGKLSGKDEYQSQMNELIIALIQDVAVMVADTTGAVSELKEAVELIAKDLPTPGRTRIRHPTDPLFDSRH